MLPLTLQRILPTCASLTSRQIAYALSISFFSLFSYSSYAQLEDSTQEKPALACKNYDMSRRSETGAFKELEGKRIHSIDYKQVNVFDENDPKENNRIYRFLNILHITTRKNVVSSQLLFKVGDTINAQTMEESGRVLRTRKYLTDAYIAPEKVCGDEVDITVVTRDAWALEPEVSFSHKSSDNQTGFGVSDGNIFGTGNAFSIGYSENEQRNSISYSFSNPHFFNKPVAVDVLYEDTSDGRNTVVDISHPFYALDTPWSAGAQYSDLSQVDIIRSRGEIVNEFRHRSKENIAYYGLATDINSKFTQRWLVGVTQEEDSFFDTEKTFLGIPMRDKAVYPWVEYQYIENKFTVLMNVNQILRPEDIAAGEKVTARIGYGGKSFGNPDDLLRYKIDYERFMSVGDNHIFEFEAKLDGRQHMGIDELDPNLLTSSLAYHYLQDEKNRWYARVEYGIGSDLPQYKELTVGDITGLRGYPTDYVRGNKRYSITLERRYFSDIYLFNIIRMGGVVFVDAGKAWGLPNQPYSPLLSDVGVGLRFSSTKVRVGNVVHIDIATPMTEKSGISKYQLIIGAEQKF